MVTLPELGVYAALGVLGAALYVVSYVRVVMNWSAADQLGYFALNLVAASLVLISLSEAFNLGAALIQVFFVVMSIVGIGRRLHRLRRLRHLGPTAERRHGPRRPSDVAAHESQ
jgi:hypothetical protein